MQAVLTTTASKTTTSETNTSDTTTNNSKTTTNNSKTSTRTKKTKKNKETVMKPGKDKGDGYVIMIRSNKDSNIKYI